MHIERGKDDNGVRRYTDGDIEHVSVSEILNELDEDKTGLNIWRGRNDGSGDNAHHAHLLWYMQNRGTLCHYYALQDLTEDGRDLWSHEETESMRAIQRGPTIEDFEEMESVEEPEAVPTNNRAVAYSIMHNQDAVSSRREFEEEWPDATIASVFDYDVEYFRDIFKDVCLHLGINTDSVIAVEQMMLSDELGYGGQTDLVYEDPNGDVVVADLKTSGGLRWKHRLQAVAYGAAVEESEAVEEVESVDRVEVIRIDPDDKEWQVFANEVPSHVEHLHREGRPHESKYTDETWYTDPWDEFDYDDLEEMWEHFEELVKKAHETHYSDD